MIKKKAPDPIPGRIAVVGACASGKSELVARLQELGYDARHCGQDHSYVPDMWQQLTRPEVLIYLDVSLETMRERRRADYDTAYLAEQERRLAHARAHADICIETDSLGIKDVFHVALSELQALGLDPPEPQ